MAWQSATAWPPVAHASYTQFSKYGSGGTTAWHAEAARKTTRAAAMKAGQRSGRREGGLPGGAGKRQQQQINIHKSLEMGRTAGERPQSRPAYDVGSVTSAWWFPSKRTRRPNAVSKTTNFPLRHSSHLHGTALPQDKVDPVHMDEHGAHVGHAAGVVAVLVLRAHAEVRQAGAVAAATGLCESVGAGAHVVVRLLVKECIPKVDPEPFFQSCVYDMCRYAGQQSLLCDQLQAYTDACHSAGAKVHPWRSPEFCREYRLPPTAPLCPCPTTDAESGSGWGWGGPVGSFIFPHFSGFITSASRAASQSGSGLVPGVHLEQSPTQHVAGSHTQPSEQGLPQPTEGIPLQDSWQGAAHDSYWLLGGHDGDVVHLHVDVHSLQKQALMQEPVQLVEGS
ncbi:hypothetical protein CRUP_013671 [Coryphaenoides rupestris]|nr:hypothetical protein CRUP_013671 [Coryphaenoides rupestris]